MLRTFSFTAAGGHIDNEDAFQVVSRPDAPNIVICSIADGQGGQAAGGPAASRAVRSCVEQAQRTRLAHLLVPHTWKQIITEADRAVHDEPDVGFTTLVALATDGRFVCGASVGDSAAVLMLPGKPLVVLTDDQEKNPPIGSASAWPVAFGTALTAPWTLVLMTDGVWKYTNWQAVLAGPMRPGDVLLAELQAQARLRPDGPFQDDFTVIILQDDGTR